MQIGAKPGIMGAMTHSISTRQQGPICIVTLDRADVRNAVDADTARQLYGAFVAFDKDPA